MRVIALLKECPYLEFNVMDNPLRTQLMTEPLRPVGGIIAIPDKPGLGLTLDSDAVKKYTRGERLLG